MSDETATGDKAADDIVYSAPLTDIDTASLGQSKSAARMPGVRSAIADEVGLALPTPPQANLARVLQEARLAPHDRDTKALVTPPAAPPIGVVPTYTPHVAAPTNSAVSVTPPTASIPPVSSALAQVPAFTDAPSPVVPLHTMKEDLQWATSHNHLSLVKMAALEAQKRTALGPPPPIERQAAPRSKRHPAVFLIVAAITCVVLGGGALYATYYVATQKTSVPATAATILFAEQKIAMPIGGQRPADVKQYIQNVMTAQSAGSNSITQIVPALQDEKGQLRPATPAEFFTALGIYPPDELLQALSPDFFFGIHAADVPSPVFILPVTSYDHAFAGMLAWESQINQQLAPLVREVSPYLPTTSSTTLPVARTFSDAVMRNYDVRVLRDDAGNAVLYYSFPNPHILIIASSLYTFPEVLSRLQAQRKL